MDILGKNDVNADYIGAETIRARAEDKIVAQAAEAAIPANPEAICGNPPQKIEKMRTRQFRDAMPNKLRRINILDALAVDVYLKFRGQMKKPFDHDPLAAVAFVEKR
jgi:hypothetical protein